MCARSRSTASRKHPSTRDSNLSFDEKNFPQDFRKQEVAELQEAIRARESRLLIGVPQVGVSSLLRFVLERKRFGKLRVYTAYVNCASPAACADVDTFYERIARELSRAKFGTADPNEHGYARLEELIRQGPDDKNVRVVVMVDQADRFLEKKDKEFYDGLEQLTDAYNRLLYVFAVNSDNASEVDRGNSLFPGRRMYVRPLNARDTASAIAVNQERHDLTFNPVARLKITRMSGGHPGLLRGIIPASKRRRVNWSQPEEALVELLSREADVKARCEKIWEALNTNQQQALNHIVKGRAGAPDGAILAVLEALGLVIPVDGSLRLFSSVFAKFVQEQKIVAEATSPHAQVEVWIDRVQLMGKKQRKIATHGRVLVKGQTLHLSQAEFQLVALLTQRRGIHYYGEIENYVLHGGTDDEDAPPLTKASSELHTLVSEAREKLGTDFIKNHARSGYEFIGEVEVKRSDQT